MNAWRGSLPAISGAPGKNFFAIFFEMNSSIMHSIVALRSPGRSDQTMLDDRESHHRRTAALLRRVADADTSALEELHDSCSGTLFGVILSVLRNREEAEDVLQEVFVSVWERAAQFDPDLGKPISWLITVARNRAYDRARSLGRKAELKSSATEDLAARTLDSLRTQWAPALQEDDAARLSSALDSLPAEQKEAIALAYLEGLTQQEIAKRLDTPLGTVKARVRRGLLRLRDQLHRHFSTARSNDPPSPFEP